METTYIKEIYGVLDKYNIEYTVDGVKINLDEWQRNKAELINLLRKHPNWNEEALAVIFEVTESREIDRRLVQTYRDDIFNLSRQLETTQETQDNLYSALYVVTGEYNKVLLHKCNVESIKKHSGVICTVGQKTSRVINKICQKFGLDKHPEFNARFAKLADSLNPLQVKRTALLSVHPGDYLEMSNRDNSWSSCHRLTDGGYGAGTLSYMNDEVSMIFYTVDDGVTADYHKNPKITREVFCYGEGILLQSRLYPKIDNEETKDIYRNIVQQTIATCLNVPNLWILKKEQSAVDKYYETHSDSLHYKDYTYAGNKANVSLLKSIHNENNKISIGYTAYCVDCSEELTDTESINCCCGKYVTCEDCEARIHEDDARLVGNEQYCSGCVSYCDYCDTDTRDEMHTVYDRRGNELTVCERCRDEDFHYCEECGEYFHCDYGNYVDDCFYCNDCLEDKFTKCSDCGKYVQDDDMVEVGSYFYCEDCAENIEIEDETERQCA